MSSVEAARAGTLAIAERQGRSRSWLSRAIRNRNLMIGVTMFLTLVAIGLLAPVITGDPQAQDYANTLRSPGLDHPFGTDYLGRDILTRIVHGARIDLKVGVVSVISPFLIGILLGMLAGYYGGRTDTVVMRAVDLVQAFPFLVLVIFIFAILGPGLTNMYIAVAIVAWIVYARLIRGEILVEKNKEYVQAAKAIGGSDWRIIKQHLLPNVITSSIVYAMADIALYILLAAALSFLGLGEKPPSPEWGAMITEGKSFMTTAWWMSAFPGLAIVITGISLSLIGDGLGDLLRPDHR
jgi:peptide/nickel transport system permease protein